MINGVKITVIRNEPKNKAQQVGLAKYLRGLANSCDITGNSTMQHHRCNK